MFSFLSATQILLVEKYFLIFVVCTFVGWLIEVSYRSFQQKHFVNAGFLKGPFLPIYGAGALLVLGIDSFSHSTPLWTQWLIYGVTLTLVEYAIGATSEKVFGVVLWDYSQNRFQLNGRICLFFSILWATLATFFRYLMYPYIVQALALIGGAWSHVLAMTMFLYFVVDFLISLAMLGHLVSYISRIHLHNIGISDKDVEKMKAYFARLLNAYPNLKGYWEASFQYGIKNRIDEKISELHRRFFDFVASRLPRDQEFRGNIRDIIRNAEFQRLREFFHHKDSIYHHSLRVALLSYRIGKYAHMDYRAMARGGLLHDFFLYDWRRHDLPDLAKHKFHGFAHPHIALRNAELHFQLTNWERDIIVKHMWPLTLRPPRYKEALVVSLVDKYVASGEFWERIRGNQNESVRFSTSEATKK